MSERKRESGRLKSETDQIKQAVRERTVGYLAAALGLVAGLAWNEAIKGLIERLFPQEGESLLAKFGYAIGVTILIVILTVYMTRLLRKNE